MTDAEMIGTGRLNDTGGAGTVTVPKNVMEAIGEKDVVWFGDGEKVYMVPRSEVTL